MKSDTAKGEIGVKAHAWVLFSVCALMLLPVASVQGTIVNLPDKHVSIDVPADWTWQRNYTIVGVTYDLWIEGPVSGGHKPVATLLIFPWPGSITDDTLYAQMTYSIDELKTSYGSANVQVVSEPVNTTLNGERASDATVLVTASGVTIRERCVIVASGAWKLGYGLALAVVDVQWSNYSATFSTIVNSLTVAEKEKTAGGLLMPVIIGIGLVVVVVIITVVLLAVRKKNQAAAILSPVQVSPQAVQPPAPLDGMQSSCPYCGNQVVPGAAFCPGCGRRLV